jgi:hypothetical protein
MGSGIPLRSSRNDEEGGQSVNPNAPPARDVEDRASWRRAS